jgi:hypothetical protein
MNQGNDPASDPTRQPQAETDPYQLLGIGEDASFDEVQAARQVRISELENDPIACSRVEAAYDAILMNRLRERQQGRVSTAARSASQREQGTGATGSRPAAQPLQRFVQPGGVAATRLSLPSLETAGGRELWFPLVSIGGLVGLLLVLPAPPAELLLSLATLVTLLNLQRRHGRFLAALAWSFGLLALGLLLGSLLLTWLEPSLPPSLPNISVQLQSLPALLLLLLGALLIA